jgi:hypothetical protein
MVWMADHVPFETILVRSSVLNGRNTQLKGAVLGPFGQFVPQSGEEGLLQLCNQYSVPNQTSQPFSKKR